MFKYSLDNKRYHTLDYYYKKKYGKKTFKVSLNGNFTCPNRMNGNTGCIFCSSLGSGEFAGNKEKDLITQFNEVKEIMEKKWPNSYYIGYFQANTNTFAPVSQLKEKYETILSIPNVVGLNIATRSDAITDECYDYLEELNKKTDLTIELGLQTINEQTLKLINRGHDLKNFETAVKNLQKRNIRVIVHIINGLPYETKEDMLNTVRYLNNLKIDGLKIHMLQILKNTPLADYYQHDKFKLLSKEEYIDIVISQLELLNPQIVINRLTSGPKKEDLIAPDWLLTNKLSLLNEIDQEMVKRNTYQGQKIKK